jgi:hypothetical protein
VDIPEAQNTRAEYSTTMVKAALPSEAARAWLDFIAGETALAAAVGPRLPPLWGKSVRACCRNSRWVRNLVGHTRQKV